MKIILIKSKLKGFLIQAAVVNPLRFFRIWNPEITLRINLPNSSFPPKEALNLHKIRFIIKILLYFLKKDFALVSEWPEALASTLRK